MSSDRPLHVAVLLYDGCFVSEAFTLVDLLHIANRTSLHLEPERPAPFDVCVVGAQAGEIVSATAQRIAVHELNRATDLVVVPGFDLLPVGGLDRRLVSLEREVSLLALAANRGCVVASICVGAFLLGRAGLLDHHRATTAWLFAEHLASMFPAAVVDATEMLIDDRGVITTAAFSAAADLANVLISWHASEEVTRLVGRITLTAEQRPSQTPFVDWSLLQSRQPSFAAGVIASMRRDLDKRFDLRRLAAEFHLSTRSLLRRFGHETGTSPLQYMQHLRVERAKQLLESTDQRLYEIASHVGYSDQAAFRKIFVNHTATTPSMYRQRFRAHPDT